MFWALAAVTLIAAAAAVVTHKPVYTALWFALSLLGTAGLLLFDGAQFLSISTVAVYAGAILVTFLFVIMLAQPEGHAPYDRITWGWYTQVGCRADCGFAGGGVDVRVECRGGPLGDPRGDGRAARRAASGAHGAIRQ